MATDINASELNVSSNLKINSTMGVEISACSNGIQEFLSHGGKKNSLEFNVQRSVANVSVDTVSFSLS